MNKQSLIKLNTHTPCKVPFSIYFTELNCTINDVKFNAVCLMTLSERDDINSQHKKQ